MLPTPTPTPIPTPTPVTFEGLVSGAETPEYDDYLRNNESYEGRTVYFVGRIAQVIEGPERRFQLLVQVSRPGIVGRILQDPWTDAVWAFHTGERFRVEDVIEFVGESLPLVTYQTVRGDHRTIPGIDAWSARISE